jgi:hypothetical protein
MNSSSFNTLKDVYYEGDEDKWKDLFGDPWKTVTVHYNSKIYSPEDTDVQVSAYAMSMHLIDAKRLKDKGTGEKGYYFSKKNWDAF